MNTIDDVCDRESRDDASGSEATPHPDPRNPQNPRSGGFDPQSGEPGNRFRDRTVSSYSIRAEGKVMFYERWLLKIGIEILRQTTSADIGKPQPPQSPGDDLGVTWNGGSEFTIDPTPG